MTNLLSKAILGLVAVAGTGSSVWGSYSIFIKPKTIEDQLSWNNLRPLDTSTRTTGQSPNDYEKWTEIINKWSTDNELQTFVGQIQDNSEDKRLPALKEKCKSIMKEPIEEKKYKNAEKYCATAKNN